MKLFDRERRLRGLERETERRRGRLEVLEEEIKMWPPARSKFPSGGYPTGYGFGEEERPTSWRKAFIWEWERAGSEEEQNEVFAKYVRKLYTNPTLGFTKESAARRLLSVLASKQRGELL